MQQHTALDLGIISLEGGIHMIPPDQLLANPANARRHPASQRDAVRASLAALGWISPVIVNTTTAHLIDGHARVEEALSADVPAVPVVYVTLTPEQEALALAAFDPITGMATYDQEALAYLLGEIQTEDAALVAVLGDLAAAHDLTYPTTTPPSLTSEPPRTVRQLVLHYDAEDWPRVLGGLAWARRRFGVQTHAQTLAALLKAALPLLDGPEWERLHAPD